MGLDYFKGWMEGFAAGIGDAPTPEQWAKVLAVLAKTSDGIRVLPAAPYNPLYPDIGAWPPRVTSAVDPRFIPNGPATCGGVTQ